MPSLLQEESYGSVRIASINRTELLARLRIIAERVQQEYPEVTDVRIAGSIARGDHTGESDVDVLIVLQQDPVGDRLELIRTYYALFDLPIGVDIFVCGQAEVSQRVASRRSEFGRLWNESRSLLRG